MKVDTADPFETKRVSRVVTIPRNDIQRRRRRKGGEKSTKELVVLARDENRMNVILIHLLEKLFQGRLQTARVGFVNAKGLCAFDLAHHLDLGTALRSREYKRA